MIKIEEKNIHIVYMHYNLINGKRYIGQTKNIKKRWHPNAYKGSREFYYAIQKYGWENFNHIILKDQLTQKEANYWEKYYIDLYKTINPEYGYNLLDGSSQNPILFGENNGFFQKKHTEESIKIMKEKKYGGNNPMAKKIECLTTGEIFPSCREASDWCGISRQNIQRCARGGRPTAGKHPKTKEKLKWRFIDD